MRVRTMKRLVFWAFVPVAAWIVLSVAAVLDNRQDDFRWLAVFASVPLFVTWASFLSRVDKIDQERSIKCRKCGGCLLRVRNPCYGRCGACRQLWRVFQDVEEDAACRQSSH